MLKIFKYLLLFLILLNIIYVISGTYFYPLASIDAIGIWLLKAKFFYLSGGFPLQFLKNPMFIYSHPHYSLLLPFVISVFYFLLGGVKEPLVVFIYPLTFIAILFIIYKLLRGFEFSQITALIFTYIYSMLSPLLALAGRKHVGEADIFILLANLLVVFIALKMFKNKVKNLGTILIVLIIMLASQIKLEGIFILVTLIFLPIPKKTKLISGFISLIPFLIWNFAAFYLRIPNDFGFLIPPLKEIFPRIFAIAGYVFLEMVKINNWYIFWPVFLLSICLLKSKNTFLKKFVIPSFLIISLLYFVVYLFSSINPATYVPPSIDRVLIQISPFYFLWFALLIKEILPKRFSQ
jgi:hypothetical protein